MEKLILQPTFATQDILGVDMDAATGDKAVFCIPYSCTVIAAMAVVTEGCAGSTSTPVVKFDKRPTAGSDTNRTDGTVAHFVLSTTAAGKVMYDYAGNGVELPAGSEVVVELTTAAVGTPTGHIRPFLIVLPDSETIVNETAAVVTA